MKGLAQGLVLGTLLGLALFALEGAAIGPGAAGLSMGDTEGPFAALLRAVRPQLPGLLGRVAVAYLLAFAALGAAAGALASLWRVRRRLPLIGAELAALVLVLAWAHAIARPALFDDVAALRPLLAALVRGGEPWHVWLAAGLFAAAHLVPLVRHLSAAPRRLVAAAALAVLGVGFRPAPPRGPLLLLVGIDALRPDKLAQTPNLAAFVNDATLYTRAYTPIAQTEPAWRSLVTSRWPNVAGSRYPLTAEARWPKLPTFPAQFAAAGWSTYFETDCSRFNFQSEASGFAVRRQPPRGALNFVLEKLRFRALGVVADNALGAYLVPELVENRAVAGLYDPLGYAQRLTRRIVDAAEQGPTLYAFHATAAHFPGDPVYPFYRQRVRADAPLERRLRMVFTPIASGGGPSPGGWSAADSEALYDELIAEADAQLGIVLEGLKEAGLYQQAVIVVFSDHGESFHADTPALGGATPVHGARLGDEENRIVLALKAGAIGRSDALVRLIDVGPQLLAMAGLAALPGADGAPFADDGRLLYAETGFTHASPAAFDAAHLARAPREFSSYRVRDDGVIEMSEQAHGEVLAEKDVGAFDGQHWLTRAPLADGTTRQRCDGACERLAVFLEAVQKEQP